MPNGPTALWDMGQHIIVYKTKCVLPATLFHHNPAKSDKKVGLLLFSHVSRKHYRYPKKL